MNDSKSQTMQQRFGFQDKELTTPKHDEIMLWLDNELDINMGKFIDVNKFKYENVDIYPSYQKYKDGYYDMRKNIPIEQFSYASLPDYPKIVVGDKTWEYAIVTNTQSRYTIGFADMQVYYKIPNHDIIYFLDTKSFSERGTYNAIAYYEIKPKIESLGEIIRQIRMYETYTTDGSWYVVSPDDKFERQLKAQGIGFIKADV